MTAVVDMAETIIPNSDQLNADDLIPGPRLFTVDRVSGGSSEQPVNIHLVELPGRPYRPSKSMRRVLVAVWGKTAADYVGRRLVLYRDPEVRFGADKVGGIKISHMSHMDGPLSVSLTVTRGKKAPHVVEPLSDPTPKQPPVTAEQIAECVDLDQLRGWYRGADADTKALIEARVAEIQPAPADGGDES